MAFEEPKWDSCIQSMLSFLKRFFLEGLRWRARQSYAFGRRDPKMAKNQEPIMQHDYIHFAFAEVLRRLDHNFQTHTFPETSSVDKSWNSSTMVHFTSSSSSGHINGIPATRFQSHMTRHADRGGRLHKRAATARALYAQFYHTTDQTDSPSPPWPRITAGTAPFWAVQQSQVAFL